MINLIKFKTLCKSISILSIICFFFFTSCTDDPPTCVITDPADEAVILQGTSVVIEADANDDDGTLFRKPSVEKVNFLIDGILVATVTSAPYSYTWNTAGEALSWHTITTVAIDGGDNSTQSEIEILLNDAPSCEISSPADNYDAFEGSEIEISVTADDDIGGIDGVDFYVDNSLIGTDDSSPYSYAWSTSDATIGNHSVKAVAVDHYYEETGDQITVEIKECLVCGKWEAEYTGYDPERDKDVTIKRTLIINSNTVYIDSIYGQESGESNFIAWEYETGNWIISNDGTSISWTPTTAKRIDIESATGTLEDYDRGTHDDQISLDAAKEGWQFIDEDLEPDVEYVMQKEL
jgi:hypothetical protein